MSTEVDHPHDPVPLHPPQPKDLSKVITETHDEIDNHYEILAASLESVGAKFRDKADYMDRMAKAVRERSARVKSELISAGEFEQAAIKAGLNLRDLLSSMDAAMQVGPIK